MINQGRPFVKKCGEICVADRTIVYYTCLFCGILIKCSSTDIPKKGRRTWALFRRAFVWREIMNTKPQSGLFSPEMITEPLKKNPFEKISAIVYSVLERAIFSFRLLPGTKLNVTKIAAALDVSATPVREAIEQLCLRGLVTVEQRGEGRYSNYRVFDMSNDSIRSLFIARKAIESTAACICAQKNWHVNLSELGRLAELFQRTLKSSINQRDEATDVSITSELDRQFHQLLVDSARNKYLSEMYALLNKRLDYLSIRTNHFMVMEKNPDILLALGNQHLAIYRAIKFGFADTAKNSMDEHIDFCMSSCLQNRNLFSASSG